MRVCLYFTKYCSCFFGITDVYDYYVQYFIPCELEYFCKICFLQLRLIFYYIAQPQLQSVHTFAKLGMSKISVRYSNVPWITTRSPWDNNNAILFGNIPDYFHIVLVGVR